MRRLRCARKCALATGCLGLLSLLTVVPATAGEPASAGQPAHATGLAGGGRHSLPTRALEIPSEEIEVRFVMLRATVLDGRGEVVPALSPEDFVLEENGVPQTITVFGTAFDQPLRIAFLLDVSGSMGVRGKLEAAKDAVRRFVAALRPVDEVGLLIFADGEVRVESEFSTRREPFLTRLERQEAYGQTALRDALAVAPTLLAAAGPGRKALVLITDGVDNASNMTAAEAIRLARQVQVPVYVLGLTDLPVKLRRGARQTVDDGSFFDVLSALAGRTGGEVFPVFSAAETETAVARVEARLRAQYVIGYHPAGGDAARGFRHIELTPVNRRLRVMTRRGYQLAP